MLTKFARWIFSFDVVLIWYPHPTRKGNFKMTAQRPLTKTEQRNAEPSIKDLFPDRWLSPEHLAGRRPVVAIEAVTLETLYSAQTKKPEQKLVITFHRATLRMICNKTQAFRLAELCKSENYLRWVGHQVSLSAGRAQNGKLTIIVGPIPDDTATTDTKSSITTADDVAGVAEDEYTETPPVDDDTDDQTRYES